MGAVLSLYKHTSCVSEELTPRLAAARPHWEQLCAELSKEEDRFISKSLMSDREKQAWSSLAELRATLQEVATKSPGSQEHLLLACYTLWPPPRGGDLSRIRIVTQEEPSLSGDTGVLVLNDADKIAVLVVSSHKTARSYGALRRTLPPELRAIVTQSLEAQPRNYLFMSKGSSSTGASGSTPATPALLPFSATTFNTWANRTLKRLMGKPTTCNTCRHAFISALDTSRMSLEQQGMIAGMMGHSLKQQGNYRRLQDAPLPIVGTDGTLTIPLKIDGQVSASPSKGAAASMTIEQT